MLHDTHALAGQAPVLDVLAASAAHHSRFSPQLAPTVAADAAFLLAHAADPGIEHALDGRLPPLLAKLDAAPAHLREEVFNAAKRAAATPRPALDTAGRAPVTRLGLRHQGDSWLRDEGLRERLGAAVRSSLQFAEARYTGEHQPGARWTPGTMPLRQAFQQVSANGCRAGGLHRSWVPFVEVQMAHVVARANELPVGSGPLDERIPACLVDLARLEAITQADILNNAHYYYRYLRPDHGRGVQPPPPVELPRPQAALPRPVRTSSSSAATGAPVAAPGTPVDPSRRSSR